jgi:hypothetical protein
VSNSAGSKDDPSSTDAEAFEQLHNVHVLRHGGKVQYVFKLNAIICRNHSGAMML